MFVTQEVELNDFPTSNDFKIDHNKVSLFAGNF